MTRFHFTLSLTVLLAGACSGQTSESARDTSESSSHSEPRQSADSSAQEELAISAALHFEAGTRPINVLLLTVDTLRVDRLNSNGYTKRVTTPNLDAMLSGAVNLTKHHSCASWTYPAFICAYSGQDQFQAGFWPQLQPYTGGEELSAFPGPFPSFVVDLNDRGFQTAMVTGNQVLRAFGLEAGFDVHIKCPTPECLVGPEGAAAATTNKAMETFESFDRSRPWLLQVHYFDPHLPNYPPPHYRDGLGPLPDCSLPFRTMEEQTSALNRIPELEDATERENCLDLAQAYYDAEIRFVDDEIGRLLAFAESKGIWEDTVLVYFSDHGEAYFDHGRWGHGSDNFQEQTAATGAFYQPGNLRPFTVTGPTTNEDMAPTLYALLGTPPPQAFTGTVIDNDPDRLTFQLNYHSETAQHSVTSAIDKLIYTADCSPMQYYNLVTDPLEIQNIYEATDPRVQALWQALKPRILELSAADEDYSPCGAETW